MREGRKGGNQIIDGLRKENGTLKLHSYKLWGYPLYFLVWIYESIPKLCDGIAERIGDGYPRVLNWKNAKHISYKQLTQDIFNQKELEVRPVLPNDFEKELAIVKDLNFDGNIMVKDPLAYIDFVIDLEHPSEKPEDVMSRAQEDWLLRFEASLKKYQDEIKLIKSNQLKLSKEMHSFMDSVNGRVDEIIVMLSPKDCDANLNENLGANVGEAVVSEAVTDDVGQAIGESSKAGGHGGQAASDEAFVGCSSFTEDPIIYEHFAEKLDKTIRSTIGCSVDAVIDAFDSKAYVGGFLFPEDPFDFAEELDKTDRSATGCSDDVFYASVDKMMISSRILFFLTY
ncbi:uncharacterized protein LOC133818757 isoform X1 [Humulus lupulus]|uniref:uncharacterized protein LOC133818757 isoform X1 n=1 Tax=Humulus lupulus TaxID=3486 RepID=UPI002B41751A|nr:uncharacterized protein LOC133818757 isoform X1 [Humulus lupulus]